MSATLHWLSLTEAAHYLGVNKYTIRRCALAGKLPHVKVGRNLRFKRSDIDAILRKGGA